MADEIEIAYWSIDDGPMIVSASLVLASDELANPNKEALIKCLVVTKNCGVRRNHVCNFIDGKLYYSDKAVPIGFRGRRFNADNVEEVCEFLELGAADWARANG